MSDLLTIGRFAQCTGLTVKALRLYDRSGLLRPSLVDVTSGYRYYAHDQVSIGQSIQTMRALHMPLAEIATIVSTDNLDTIDLCLQRHRQRLADWVREYESALTLLPTSEELYRISRKGRLMNMEVKAYTCSFCDRGQADVERMIAGPRGAAICNDCVAKCSEIIAEEEAKRAGESA